MGTLVCMLHTFLAPQQEGFSSQHGSFGVSLLSLKGQFLSRYHYRHLESPLNLLSLEKSTRLNAQTTMELLLRYYPM